MRSKCDGRPNCNYRISLNTLGDPAKGCNKNFIWYYKCKNAVESSRSGFMNYHEVDGVGGHLVQGKWYVASTDRD